MKYSLYPNCWTETGLEKDTVKSYAHIRLGIRKPGEVKLEAKFKVPDGFGEIGAILLENEHRKEIFIGSIELEGFPNGPVTVSCNSWVHSKRDNPKKRIFFTNKVLDINFFLQKCPFYFKY